MRVIHPGIGVQIGVLEVFEDAAMVGIGAPPRNHADFHCRRTIPAQIYLRGLDSHLRDVFDARLHHRFSIGETAAAKAVADRRRAIEIGAKGYVSKSGDPHDLVEAIREVGDGRVYLPAAIARSIAFAGPAVAQSPLSKLTPREVEILRLLSVGKSLSEIAWLVHASYKTIANTSSIIRQKLGLRSSSELVRFAIESRLA